MTRRVRALGAQATKISLAAFTLAALLSAGGCLSGPDLNATGNETSVVVSPTTKVEDALTAADKHCSGYKRIAHFKRLEGDRAIFECDKRST